MSPLIVLLGAGSMFLVSWAFLSLVFIGLYRAIDRRAFQ